MFRLGEQRLNLLSFKGLLTGGQNKGCIGYEAIWFLQMVVLAEGDKIDIPCVEESADIPCVCAERIVGADGQHNRFVVAESSLYCHGHRGVSYAICDL